MTSGAKSDINITPLIDIVLVLLIIFIVMVPTLSKVAKAVLPTISNVPPPTDGTPLVVTLDSEGKLFLQQEAVPWSELAERLVPPLLLQPVGHRKVFLKVDGSLPHGHAVRAMDLIRVSSDLARARTRQRGDLGDEDGGETKVVMSLKKG
jgi:biopolymer transport protein ExbD